jgi:plastocyanin
MKRLRPAALAIVLVLLSLVALQNSPVSHSGPAITSSSTASIHLVGQVSGWNATNPAGTNPTITVNQGDSVSIILTSGDITHKFALDLDNDTAQFGGVCPSGDICSDVFGLGPGTKFNFTASFAPGRYVYFCTFHPTMVGSFVVRASSPLPVAITGVSPNPADTGALVTLTYSVANPSTLSGISVHWGDGTITHPSLSATSDTHTYRRTDYVESQVFTINVTATNSAGQAFATISETVKDRPTTLTITSLSPNPAKAGQTVALNFAASDPDGIVQATWIDWGDGSVQDLILNETSSSMCQRLDPSLQSNACTLAPGDLLFSQPADPTTIVNGTIIIFRPYSATPNYLVAHRVIKILPATGSMYNQITFWTAGDANRVPDAWDQISSGIPASQVVAVYQHILPPPLTPSARDGTHTYSSPGSYAITVTAMDDSGSSNRISSLPLAVTAPSSPTAPTPTILGLAPIEFYGVIGILATIVVTAMFLTLRRSRKP